MAKRRTIDWVQRLGSFLDEFNSCFVRVEHCVSAQSYLAGLLSGAERKNILGLKEQEHGSAGYQALQHFISHAPWDSEEVWLKLRRWLPERRGVLIVDDTGFPKQGRHSAGVARQYSGTLGKTGNCQIAVSCVLRTEHATLPLALDLYVPEHWINDDERRRKAGVPAELRMRRKWEIALEQIRRVIADGVEIECVVADAAYGDVVEFRKGLDELGLPYVVAIKTTTTAVVAETDRSRRASARPQPKVRARSIAYCVPADMWRSVTWRRGTKGPLRAEFTMIPVHIPAQQAGSTDKDVSILLCERDPQNPTEKKYYLSNLPWGTTLRRLVALAHTRWAIEQSYQQMKEELGLDHFEGRSYAGFHRHAVLTALSFAFLQSERLRHHSAAIPTLPQMRRLVKRIVGLLTIVTDKQLRAEFEFLARRYPANTS